MTSGTEPRGEDLKSRLTGLPPFEDLDANSLEALAGELDWLSLPSGQCLFDEGDRDDSLYVVISGRLGAFLFDDDGHQTLVRQMIRRETVGELALLSGEPRSAAVFALRDSELVRLSKSAFERLVEEHPRTLRFITDLLVERLRRPRRPASKEAPRTIALVPLGQQEPAHSDRRTAKAARARPVCRHRKSLHLSAERQLSRAAQFACAAGL